MAKVSTNIAIDAELKKQAQELFADLGMDLTTAITVFLKRAVSEQCIPFDVMKKVPNNEVASKASEGVKSGVDVYGPFDSVDELVTALNSKNEYH